MEMMRQSSGSGVAGSRKAKPELPNAIPEDVQEVVKNFSSIADEASGMIRGFLKKARLSLGGDNRLADCTARCYCRQIWLAEKIIVQELEQLIEETDWKESRGGCPSCRRGADTLRIHLWT